MPLVSKKMSVAPGFLRKVVLGQVAHLRRDISANFAATGADTRT